MRRFAYTVIATVVLGLESDDREALFSEFEIWSQALFAIPIALPGSTFARAPILAALLDGPFRWLRDDNPINPHRILVWDQQLQPVIQALKILELLGRYPCGDDEEAQWCAGDLLAILQRNHDLLRMSLVAHDIADELDDAEPTCGTVVLIVNPDRQEPHRWTSVLSLVLPR